MIRDAAAIVRSRLRQVLGLPAVITRGQLQCSCTVTLGRSNAIATAVNEFKIDADAQEILIQASDYKPTGIVTDPQDNDRIMVTLPDQSIAAFDVRPPNPGEQCFNANAFGTELRVHCRGVDGVPMSI
jgi:hypothetical protein